MVGVVLAGGRSRRMGRDKAFVELLGRPLVAWSLDAVRGAGLSPLVSGATVPDIPTCPDPPGEDRHPARGIAAAIEWAGGPVVVVACDTPFVPSPLLAWLAAHDGPEAVSVRGQPLIGRYAEAAPLLAAAGDGTPLHALMRREVDPAAWGDPARITFNVNTPEDLERAAALASAAM